MRPMAQVCINVFSPKTDQGPAAMFSETDMRQLVSPAEGIYGGSRYSQKPCDLVCIDHGVVHRYLPIWTTPWKVQAMMPVL